MNLREKRQIEREEQKKKREQLMIEAAIACFCAKGIELVTMNEIAAKAEIGVATVYRYFDTKEQLAIQCSIYLWRRARKVYLEKSETEEFRHQPGIEQVRMVLLLSAEFYEKQTSFFRFMYDFDNYLASHQIDPASRNEYETTISEMIDMFSNVIRVGKADGSIRFDASVDEIYFCVTHALFSMMQKLASNGNLVQEDSIVEARRQIELVISLLIKGLQSE